MLGKYSAAACLLLHGKIRSKKQLVPPYLHGVNSPALQWIPGQAHCPSRKSSKHWEKRSTLFLDKRPPQLPACCGKRQQKKGWWRGGFRAQSGAAGNGTPPPDSLEHPGKSHCEALSHCNTYPQHPLSCQKALFPNAFSQYWAFLKCTQKGKGHRKARASPAGIHSCQSHVMLVELSYWRVPRTTMRCQILWQHLCPSPAMTQPLALGGKPGECLT